MKTSKKITIFLIILAIVIASVIVARHFVGKHFQKKFSKYPPPGVIVEVVQSSNFFESIETFGTALSKKNKNFRVKKSEILDEKILIGKVFNEGEVLLRTKNEAIIAPFKGVLGKREIAQGVLGTESFILTLDDTSSIIMNIKVPEIYLKILKPGLIAEVRSDAFEQSTFRGLSRQINRNALYLPILRWSPQWQSKRQITKSDRQYLQAQERRRLLLQMHRLQRVPQFHVSTCPGEVRSKW